MAGFTAAQVPRLKLKWAFGFPGDVGADAQPTIAGGRVFVGSQSGTVYSLNAATGCIHWSFQAAAPVRAAVTIGRIDTKSGARYAAFIGDRAANVYAVDAATGKLLWKTRVDDFPIARVTGSPVFHNGRLYVGWPPAKKPPAHRPAMSAAVSAAAWWRSNGATGAQVWKTYTITEDAQPTKKNKVGTQMWGPSGAPIWTSPAIDVRRNALYVTTGRQLQRSADQDERRIHGVRSGFRQDPLVPPDAGGGRLERGLPPAGYDELSRLEGPRFRLRVSAHSGDARERPPGARGGPEIRRRPCARSRSGRRRVVAGAHRQGWHQWRRSMGLGRRPVQCLRGALRYRTD